MTRSENVTDEASIEKILLGKLWVAHFLFCPQTVWNNFIIIVLICDLNT